MQRARGAAALVRNKGSPGCGGGAQLCQSASGHSTSPGCAGPPDTGSADTARLTPTNRRQHWHFSREWNELNIHQSLLTWCSGLRLDINRQPLLPLSESCPQKESHMHYQPRSKEEQSVTAGHCWAAQQAGVLLIDSPSSSTVSVSHSSAETPCIF